MDRCVHGRIPARCTPCARASRTRPPGFPTRVWITEKGKMYHRSPSCIRIVKWQGICRTQGMNTYKPREVTIDAAEFTYERRTCPDCFPELNS
ncbi:hypothetical protein AB0J52_11855 [Spirillospora sp. NPDC049652]